MSKSKCEHSSGSLEYKGIDDYSTEEYVKIKVIERCNDCGKIINREIHNFKFSNIEVEE